MSANIVKQQQAYATSQQLAKLFEDLTTALIYARPPDPAAFIAEEVTRMAREGEAYRAKPLNGVVDTEESAAAYWEDERVRPLLEVRAALSFAANKRPLPCGDTPLLGTPRNAHCASLLTHSPSMQELFALLLHSKPENPYTFLSEESLKLRALREGSKPVRPVRLRVPCASLPHH